MIVVLYIPAVRIFEAVCFFSEAITAGYLRLLPLRSASALDMWTHLVGLKKKVVVAN